MTEKQITLSASEYRKLERDLKKLRALEAGGVDNWEWYDESLSAWHKVNAEQELVDKLADELVEFIDEASIEADVDYPGGRECGPNIYIPSTSYDAASFIELVISEYKKMENN